MLGTYKNFRLSGGIHGRNPNINLKEGLIGLGKQVNKKIDGKVKSVAKKAGKKIKSDLEKGAKKTIKKAVDGATSDSKAQDEQ